MQQKDAFPRIMEDIQTLIAGTKTRVLGPLEKKTQTNADAETSDMFLRKHIGSSLKLVVVFADLVGSTLMTRNLSVDKLATIIQIFTQEMSFVVTSSRGKVLKYVGDAIIAYFPVTINNYTLACNTAIDCSYLMITILEKAINPVISVHGYDGLRLKIGIDTSDHSVIQYAIGEKSYLDILGYGISMAAKLSSLAKSDEVIISHSIYTGMRSSLRKRFSELELDPRIWKYIDERFQPGIWKSPSLGHG